MLQMSFHISFCRFIDLLSQLSSYEIVNEKGLSERIFLKFKEIHQKRTVNHHQKKSKNKRIRKSKKNRPLKSSVSEESRAKSGFDLIFKEVSHKTKEKPT